MGYREGQIQCSRGRGFQRWGTVTAVVAYFTNSQSYFVTFFSGHADDFHGFFCVQAREKIPSGKNNPFPDVEVKNNSVERKLKKIKKVNKKIAQLTITNNNKKFTKREQQMNIWAWK